MLRRNVSICYGNVSPSELLNIRTHPQRVKVIAETLAFSLEASLKECFTGLDRGDLLSCLRTYASIDKMEQAQSVFRKFVVHDYMHEVIDL